MCKNTITLTEDDDRIISNQGIFMKYLSINELLDLKKRINNTLHYYIDNNVDIAVKNKELLDEC